jgi:hypothetical protein
MTDLLYISGTKESADAAAICNIEERDLAELTFPTFEYTGAGI